MLDAGEGGAFPSINSLHESHKGLSMGPFMVERPEHLAKLKSALMGNFIMLQHTLYTAEKQCEFLLDELEQHTVCPFSNSFQTQLMLEIPLLWRPKLLPLLPPHLVLEPPSA